MIVLLCYQFFLKKLQIMSLSYKVIQNILIRQLQNNIKSYKLKQFYLLQDSINNFQLISMPKMGNHLLILLFITILNIQSFVINIITPDNVTTNMYNNGQYNPQFVQQNVPFNCSLNTIFTYTQTAAQKISNTPYIIQFTNVSSTVLFTLTTQYKVLNPTLSQGFCSSGTCSINVQNNCAQNTGQFNYFDILYLQVNGLPTSFAYNVLCDSDFSTNTFQWGLIILLVFCLILLILVSLFSKAWSIRGAGIEMNYWIVIVFWLIVIIGGIIASFTNGVINIILQVILIIVGIVAIGICTNQILFLFKIKFLQKGIQIKDIFKIRILDVISAFVGAGFVVGYWFSTKNWILNDIICVSIIIAVIKIMKFTTLKISLFALIVSLVVQMVFVQVIHFAIGTSYNDLILNTYNFPFQLQLPAINPVYKQKCAWLAFTAIIYPGIFMSYLRRFDISRNTNIYLITAVVCFLIGSIIWVLISLGSVHSWPLQLVTGPIMIALVAIFAYKRRQIRTLWQGSFYDQQFADRDGINEIIDVINDDSEQKTQKNNIELMRNSVFSNLKINRRQDSDLTIVNKFRNMSQNSNIKQQISLSSSSNRSEQQP